MIYSKICYNQVRQKSIHNAFKQREGIYDQIIFWGARSLEFDLHNANGDWKIYHFALDPATSVDKLSDALELLRGVNHAIPKHEVITVFLDMKNKFDDTTCRPEDLDELINHSLSRCLYTPKHLMHRATSAKSLQDAVKSAGWPTLEELRGRFIFVLTGPWSRLKHYVQSGDVANDRLAFIAPGVKEKDQIGKTNYAVFFNLGNAEKRKILGKEIFNLGLISRSYNINLKRNWNHAIQHQIHHIATDKVNESKDSWSSTRNKKGWPFEVIIGTTPSIAEPGIIQGIKVRSGDLWNDRDSGFFSYKRFINKRAENTYETFISSPGSHAEDWAKGGVMARASLDSNAAYFGVFRVAENQPLRVQYRARKGADTEDVVKPIRKGRGIDREDLVFVKLEISAQGKKARAWGSVTGLANDWSFIYSYTFEESLIYQGFCASSHDREEYIRFLFGTPGDTFPPFNAGKILGNGGARAHHFHGVLL
jgi:hypothetical protein